jgi:uncharacterized zinc-type alcohol dehydrogenase-like protein
MTIKAYAAMQAGSPLEPYEYDPGPLGPDEVEVDIINCGICHSDLSMINNSWMMAHFPLIPGHEIVGRIRAVGAHVQHLQAGTLVGVGWFARSCMTCEQCMAGDHNLCAEAQGIIIDHHGGFADRVRAHCGWVIPIPEGIDEAKAGPLFCGGITVFNPILQNGIRPLDRVAVIGIGGLGHMALQFLNAWGCEVTAFSTSPAKETEARQMGAHRFVSSNDEATLESMAGNFDMVLVTVNVNLNWQAYINTLKPKGTLHFVGAAPSVSSDVFALIVGQRSISGSPLGSPATISRMLDFAQRHDVAPLTETFGMSQVNDALERLRSGQARYRIVLENDF